MKILLDTSVLVAAVVEAHPMHNRALPWLQRAKTAEKSRVERLVTFNADDFVRVWPDGKAFLHVP